MGFWKLQKHVTEVPSHRYYLRETENQDTCSIMVFLKEIVNKGCFISFLSFSSHSVGGKFSIVN